MRMSCLAVLLQFIILKIVTAQYNTVRISQSQLNGIPIQNTKQQLLNSLLATYDQDQIPERLEIITAALQQLPQKKNKVYLAEVLKQSALQSLTQAANACKGAGLMPEYGMLLPQNNALPQYVLPQNNGVPQYVLPQSNGVPQYVLPQNNGMPQYVISQNNALPQLQARDVVNIPLDYLQYGNNLPLDVIPNRTVKIQYY